MVSPEFSRKRVGGRVRDDRLRLGDSSGPGVRTLPEYSNILAPD